MQEHEKYIFPITTLVIGGTDYSLSGLINSVEIKLLADGADTVDVSLVDRELEIIDLDIYSAPVTIRATLRAEHLGDYLKFEGVINASEIDFPSEGAPVVSFTGIDDSHYLNREKKSNTWEETTKTEVMQEIAESYGLAPTIDREELGEPETVTQSDQTDIEFLESLAKEEKDLFEVKVQSGKLIYRKRDFEAPSGRELFYRESGQEIISFRPRMSKEDLPSSAEGADVDLESLENVEYRQDGGDETNLDPSGDPSRTMDTNTMGWSKNG